MTNELTPLEVSKQLKNFVLEFVKNGLDRKIIHGSFDIIEKEFKALEIIKGNNYLRNFILNWAYEYDEMLLDNQASALASAIDYFRMRTEDDYISRARLEELATLFKDGLIEDDEYEAMIYFDEVCEMEEHEKKFFGIGEDDE